MPQKPNLVQTSDTSGHSAGWLFENPENFQMLHVPAVEKCGGLDLLDKLVPIVTSFIQFANKNLKRFLTGLPNLFLLRPARSACQF